MQTLIAYRIMEKINTIMDNIRASPVCPESGEANLLYLLLKLRESTVSYEREKEKVFHL